MSEVELKQALSGVPEFVAFAVEQLRSSLGEAHPQVAAGRAAMASLEAIPNGAMLVTEETLAAAMHRVWPLRRNTQAGLAVSAAAILAALRLGSPSSGPR
jgi:hypothetical protein